jgi:hypothetical protein
MSEGRWPAGVMHAYEGKDPETRRRGAARRPYNCQQMIAPYFGEGKPLPTDFQSAQCIDISASGLSFYWPREPAFQSVVIRLGDAQSHVNVIATVRWYSRQPTAEGYMLGCMFVGRLDN